MSHETESMYDLAVEQQKRRKGQHGGITPGQAETMIQRTRLGCFAYVAAQAAGISHFTYSNWMKRGAQDWIAHEEIVEGGDPDHVPSLYAAFWYEITKARNSARQTAETRVFKDNPLAWLTKGPGKERPGEPGWSDRTEITGANAGPVLTTSIEATPMNLRDLTDEELETLERLMAKASGSASRGQGGAGAPASP